MPAEEPAFRVIGDSLWLTWPSHQLTLEFSRISDHRDTLSAEVVIVSEAFGPVHWARVNLASTQGRGALIRASEDALPGLPWRTLIETACRKVALHLRRSEPAIPLQAAARTKPRWLVDPLIPLGEMTVLFGDGGAGKSLLALAIAIAGLQGYPLGGPWAVGDVQRVLYLDWESDRETHSERLWALTRREELAADRIFHRRLWRPLVDELEHVRADTDRHHTDLVICDSLGAASGPEPEGADAAVRTLMALRGLPGTKLVIAHVSKASAEMARSRPFGSVYVQNLARSVIEARRVEDDGDDSEMTVSLYHRKTNVGQLAKPSALCFSWDPDGSIVVQKANPDLSSAGLSRQIIDVLLGGNRSVTSLAKELETKSSVVRTTLNRMAKRNIVIKLVTLGVTDEKKHLWGLVDTRRNTDEPEA
jgi:hypothetical protein